MSNETAYVFDITLGLSQVRVRFSIDGGVVGAFMVQLEAFHKGEWKPVQRYDDYHGKPHRDYLDLNGREYRKEWLDVDRNTALTMAIDDFKANGRRYVAEFLDGEVNG